MVRTASPAFSTLATLTHSPAMAPSALWKLDSSVLPAVVERKK